MPVVCSRSWFRPGTRYSALLTLSGVVGCSQPAAPAAPNAIVVAADSQPEATQLPAASPPPAVALTPAVPSNPGAQPPAAPKADPPAPTGFTFPADTAGKALPPIVAPQAPALPPPERFGIVAKVRTLPARIVNPEPIGKITYAPPPLFPAKPSGLIPVAPAERVPLDMGVGATAVPARPALPDTPVATTKARDVNSPPDLAPLARPLPDRASLDDPTAEPGNATIVNSSPVVSLVQAGFLKVGLPDPFELADQVKPKVVPSAEPGLSPVPVNPQRPK
ncbi:MAG: hypothetical protein JWO38_4202 [Gemmataceae bacterium]|nr:hypothetical protein [Gemmataceae bacterium]